MARSAAALGLAHRTAQAASRRWACPQVLAAACLHMLTAAGVHPHQHPRSPAARPRRRWFWGHRLPMRQRLLLQQARRAPGRAGAVGPLHRRARNGGVHAEVVAAPTSAERRAGRERPRHLTEATWCREGRPDRTGAAGGFPVRQERWQTWTVTARTPRRRRRHGHGGGGGS